MTGIELTEEVIKSTTMTGIQKPLDTIKQSGDMTGQIERIVTSVEKILSTWVKVKEGNLLNDAEKVQNFSPNPQVKVNKEIVRVGTEKQLLKVREMSERIDAMEKEEEIKQAEPSPVPQISPEDLVEWFPRKQLVLEFVENLLLVLPEKANTQKLSMSVSGILGMFGNVTVKEAKQNYKVLKPVLSMQLNGVYSKVKEEQDLMKNVEIKETKKINLSGGVKHGTDKKRSRRNKR